MDLLLIPAARSPYAAQLGSNPGQLQGSYRAVAGQLQGSYRPAGLEPRAVTGSRRHGPSQAGAGMGPGQLKTTGRPAPHTPEPAPPCSALDRPPTLAQAAGGTVPLETADGRGRANNSVWPAVYPHNSACKDLHIPRLSVPTGLSVDGRPTGVQLWGRAVPYAEMFDGAASTRSSVAFLRLAARAVEVSEQVSE